MVRPVREVKRFALTLAGIAALSCGVVRADDEDATVHTVVAFNTTVYYRYSCKKDVFTIVIGAQNQDSTGGEYSLYWEIADAGASSTQDVEQLATLNTLAVQGAGGALQPNGFPPGSTLVSVNRPCSRQSLYVWAPESAVPLTGDNIVVYFSKAAEEPLRY